MVATSQSGPVISVVVPVYNEAENVEALCERLTRTLRGVGDAYEIIVVDDGSTDDTFGRLREIHARMSTVRAARLSRNFGQPLALTAGMDLSQGRYTFLLDGDLQHPPEEIPRFVERLRAGIDLVYAVKTNSKQSPFRRVVTAVFWRGISFLSGLRIPPNQLVMRGMSRRYLEALRSFPESAPFWGGLFVWAGFSQEAIEVEHSERHAGHGKYSVWRMLRMTLDAALAFSYAPLQIAGWLGLIIAAVGFLGIVYLVSAWLLHGNVAEGWSSLMVTVLFIGGVQLLFLGVLGAYLGRIYTEVKRRPRYIVQELLD